MTGHLYKLLYNTKRKKNEKKLKMHEHGTFERYVVAWHHRVDTTEGASAQCPTWIFNFGPYWQLRAVREKIMNYYLLLGAIFSCFHGQTKLDFLKTL